MISQPGARRHDVLRVRTAILAFALAATFFLQLGLTAVDLISMIFVVVAGILLLVRQALAGAIVTIIGALLTGGNAAFKAIFNARVDPGWMMIQAGVGLLALAAPAFAVILITKT